MKGKKRMKRAYERLIKYTEFETASDERNETCPSTHSQTEFAEYLVKEMKSIGITDAEKDENGYVFGTIPATVPEKGLPVIGFIAHMDVVDDVPFKNVKPHIIKNYDGGDITLNEKMNIIMSPSEFTELENYRGCDLVVTDGTTLLGADDKAGIAEIMTAAEELLNDKTFPHGKLRIGFTPDEEIGRGALRFDVGRFGADFAYTLDGAAFGEVEYETFNASSAEITINGKNIHPGSSKNKMKNALLIAMEFNGLLPEAEKPMYTEKYEGFYHLNEMNGNVEKASLHYILRDHDAEKLRKREKMINAAAEFINVKYGDKTITAEITQGYKNMVEMIKPHFHLIDNAFKAVEAVGGKPVCSPVRGGTDGSMLSYMGLPCPNLGTGSHNHHGRKEYACVQQMDKCVGTIKELARIYSKPESVK